MPQLLTFAKELRWFGVPPKEFDTFGASGHHSIEHFLDRPVIEAEGLDSHGEATVVEPSLGEEGQGGA